MVVTWAFALARSIAQHGNSKKAGTLGKYGSIVKETVRRAALFPVCSFVHESRANNFEAHNLARFASSLGVDRHVWLGTPHDTVNVPMNILNE